MKATCMAAVVVMISPMLLASDVTPSRPAEPRRADVSVFVRGDRGLVPGIPVLVRVRSKQGVVLTEGETKKDGRVSLSVEWSKDDEPEQIEAILRGGFGFAAGSLVGWSEGSSGYCIYLPLMSGSECD